MKYGIFIVTIALLGVGPGERLHAAVDVAATSVNTELNDGKSQAASLTATPKNRLLHYDAYLSGVHVGSARIYLDTTANAYRIAGSARSEGLWERFQQWRAEFAAQGVRQATLPKPSRFTATQTTPKKQRELVVERMTCYGLQKIIRSETRAQHSQELICCQPCFSYPNPARRPSKCIPVEMGIALT